MPDVGERLEKVEQGLTELSQRVDERFDEVTQRLDKIDRRLDKVDGRFDKVDGRFGEVDQRFTQLQVLIEGGASQIKLVAEVQGHHGETLQRLNDAVEPLKALQPVFEQVAKDHERRITALEGRPSSSTDARFKE